MFALGAVKLGLRPPTAAVRICSLVKIVRKVAVAVLLVVFVLVALNVRHTAAIRERAARIRVGDSESQVESLLGEPT
jgi:hypothetical protein